MFVLYFCVVLDGCMWMCFQQLPPAHMCGGVCRGVVGGSGATLFLVYPLSGAWEERG